MQATAETMDAREAQTDWPHWLPPLQLTQRLKGSVQIEAIRPSLFDGHTLTLDGPTHLVGMLSSGKSTLVLSLLLTLCHRAVPPRVAVIVSDTLQGNLLADRLEHHGIRTSLLSSVRRHEHHLNALFYRHFRGLPSTRLSHLKRLKSPFQTACPLTHWKIRDESSPDHHASDLTPVFTPCHALHKPASTPSRNNTTTRPHQGAHHACTLWSICPRQAQQKAAVGAQVIILTPQALVHTAPDTWTLRERLTWPELLQFIVDLVIIDEADSIQQSLDETFCPRLPVMGGKGDNFMLNVHEQLHRVMRQLSGGHFKHVAAIRWHKKFNLFQNLISDFYGLLQEEADSLRETIRNRPITALSILQPRWYRQQSVENGRPSASEQEDVFEQLIHAISAISASTSHQQASSNVPDARNAPPTPLQEAGLALSELAQQLIRSEHYRDVLDTIQDLLINTTRLDPFSQLSTQDKAVLMSPDHQEDHEWQKAQLQCREDALHILLALITEQASHHLNDLLKAIPAVAKELTLTENELLKQVHSKLGQHYRSLLPTSPAGAIFGWIYDAPEKQTHPQLGGTLSAIHHLGVGRHLLNHFHDLLANEGQPGPHVLMLSGTSWAGGSQGQHDTPAGEDRASPSFDLQQPIHGVLKQPQAELEAINHSRCALIDIRDEEGKQIRLSGASEAARRNALEFIAQQLLTPQDNLNRLERIRETLKRQWSETELQDRDRCLLVVNSYADARHLAHCLAIQSAKDRHSPDRKVCYLVPDRGVDDQLLPSPFQQLTPVPRSLVEKFGQEPEGSLLVAPIQVIARGHNILNQHKKAAISQIHFLHRPHPRPDDLMPTIARMNRFAQACHDQGFKADDPSVHFIERTRLMRHRARKIVRRSLHHRGGYQELPELYQAQFAWDMLTLIWQTMGRGIRGGCPVFIGFIDRQFAPRSFDWHEEAAPDTGQSSALVQAMHELKLVMSSDQDPDTQRIAHYLYAPLLKTLSNMEGLKHDIH